MSTTGHYTRYINQYPGWSDNCDTMYQSVWDNEIKIGSLTVEHYAGNKESFCYFDNWDSISHKYGYNIREHIIDYKGKLAIQNVLSIVQKFNIGAIVSDIIFKHLNFYNFAYLDYIDRMNNKDNYLPYPSLSSINNRLECDLSCVLSENRFKCDYMIAGTRSGNCSSDKNPVCKYFDSWLGTVHICV